MKLHVLLALAGLTTGLTYRPWPNKKNHLLLSRTTRSL